MKEACTEISGGATEPPGNQEGGIALRRMGESIQRVSRLGKDLCRIRSLKRRRYEKMDDRAAGSVSDGSQLLGLSPPNVKRHTTWIQMSPCIVSLGCRDLTMTDAKESKFDLTKKSLQA